VFGGSRVAGSDPEHDAEYNESRAMSGCHQKGPDAQVAESRIFTARALCWAKDQTERLEPFPEVERQANISKNMWRSAEQSLPRHGGRN
jgi:hypothetical protein